MQGLLSNELLSKSSLFGSSGSNVKSNQSGEVSMTTETVENITISSVNLNNSIVVVSAFCTDGNASTATSSSVSVRGKLTTTTNIELNRTSQYRTDGTTNVPMKIYWTVVEFNNVKSKQSGYNYVYFGETTVSISAINIQKSIAFASSISNDSSTTPSLIPIAIRLSNSTTLKLGTRATTTNYGNGIDWQVIEFD